MKLDISSMLDPSVYDHAVKDLELIETHASWVILTGEFAYKIKKPVDFGFLDFSTLEKRHHFCAQELQLNRRMAPGIYLDVVSISGVGGRPVISGNGPVLEYAIKMLQFPQSAQLDNMLLAGELHVEHMEAIAHMIARFHQSIRIADDAADYGRTGAVYRPVLENFTQIREHLDTRQYADVLNQLQQWSSSELAKLGDSFERRKRDGFVRECHGDMHLRNLLWIEGRPVAFDCIEFNPALRWIDVISDIAFLLMDLHDREEHRLANRLLNIYLEVTGDYAGLGILPFYLCYRALVRAKVNALRLEQEGTTALERTEHRKEFESYLELAMSYTAQLAPKLIIMRGVSGSGKSTLSRALLDALGAIRIRSDVERKRLFGADEADRGSGEVGADLYSQQVTQETYIKLAELTSDLVTNGYSVIVDAAFLEYKQRERFLALASDSAIPYTILEIWAPDDVLRQRIMNRKHDVSDADIAVLEHQLENWQPLQKEEQGFVISVNTARKLEIDTIIDKINHITAPDHQGRD